MKSVTHTSKTLTGFQTREDVKNSVLIVSVLVNLFIFITWLVIETSPNHAVALISSL